jgi:hypothetical protein
LAGYRARDWEKIVIDVKLRFSMGKSIFVFYVQAVVFTYVSVIHCSLCLVQ